MNDRKCVGELPASGDRRMGWRVAGLFPLVVLACAAPLPAADDGKSSFNRDIRPILAEYCFACHGPDQNARKAKLRFDVRDSAVQAGAIVPGDAASSSLIERIFETDPELIMPPPKSHKTLTADQKEKLKKWIAQGAEYQVHWSLIPVPRSVPLPAAAVAQNWARSPLDTFVFSGLQAKGWQPAPETGREQWLRRASFDLTGLPPSLAELDLFLADDSPLAYERAADRLLASPAFGERLANDWLDAARYADTFGYQSDRDMHVWPWREWVIRAFNSNLPYDQFITWQTAGDLLPQATSEQILATAFNRLHRQTNEGGSIEEEFRQTYVADRVVTNGTAFLGLTLDCARCHDHKFDPISQREFYQLAAFYANIDEHGLYSHFTETAPTPTLPLYAPGEEARHREVQARVAEHEAACERLRQEARQAFAGFSFPAAAAIAPQSAFSFDDTKAGPGYRPTPGKAGTAIEFEGDEAFVCQGAGKFDRVTPFSFALWVKPAALRAREVVLHRSVAAEDASFRGYSLVLDEGHAAFSLIHFWPGNALRVQTKEALPAGQWSHITVTYDGSSRAAGLRIYTNGRPAETVVVRNALTRDITYRPAWGDSGSPELALGARFRDVGFKDGAVDELLVFDRALTPVEVAPLAGAAVPTDDASRFEHFLARHHPPFLDALAQLQTVRREENELAAQVRQIMVMRELPQPRVTHVLKRGAYDAPAEAVEPGTPASIFPFPAEWPRNRLGLARWMTDDRNPLVSRVAVNRLWSNFFGRGLVNSVADFGSQGESPSHPELLDWLARDFLESGWNVKRFCRQVVLSATYRQASRPAAAATSAADPENVWLARGPRHRLAAEQIRDNALATAGLLNLAQGGPSVFPYQPAGLWEESGTHKTYVPSQGANLYRRGVYTFWRRTSPPPAMISFDATSRETCTAKRERTATPLQALVLLNDPQFVEAARVLAERLIVENGENMDARLASAFRLLTSRRPAAAELEVLRRLYREQRAYFDQAGESAQSFLAIGSAPRNAERNGADLAATAVVVKMLLSYDECVTKR